MDKPININNVDDFVCLVKDIVYDVLQHTNLGIEKYYDGVVLSVDESSQTATVDIGIAILENVSNKTGVDLVGGSEDEKRDVVRVYSVSPTFTDAYIGVKLN